MTHIKDFQQCHQRHHKYYAEEMTKMQSKVTEQGLAADTNSIDEDIKSLTAEFQAFKQGVYQDIRGLLR